MAGIAVKPRGNLGRNHGDDIEPRVEIRANARVISVTIIAGIEFIAGNFVKYTPWGSDGCQLNQLTDVRTYM